MKRTCARAMCSLYSRHALCALPLVLSSPEVVTHERDDAASRSTTTSWSCFSWSVLCAGPTRAASRPSCRTTAMHARFAALLDPGYGEPYLSARTGPKRSTAHNHLRCRRRTADGNHGSGPRCVCRSTRGADSSGLGTIVLSSAFASAHGWLVRMIQGFFGPRTSVENVHAAPVALQVRSGWAGGSSFYTKFS